MQASSSPSLCTGWRELAGAGIETSRARGTHALLIILNADLMDRFECQQDDDWALLAARVTLSGGRRVAGSAQAPPLELNVLVEKRGGDALALAPMEDAGLLPMLGLPSAAGMPKVSFACSILKVRTSDHASRYKADARFKHAACIAFRTSFFRRMKSPRTSHLFFTPPRCLPRRHACRRARMFVFT